MFSSYNLAELGLVDLVLEPFGQRETIAHLLHDALLPEWVAERVQRLLPLAIAQLDAIGDDHAALALRGLQRELESPPVAA